MHCTARDIQMGKKKFPSGSIPMVHGENWINIQDDIFIVGVEIDEVLEKLESENLSDDMTQNDV